MKTYVNAVLAVVAFGAVGCGNELGAFEGTWSYTDSTTVVSCPGYAPLTSIGKGNDTIVEGTDSDIVLTSNDGCNLKFNVANGVATIVPGQSCASSQQDQNGNTINLTASFTTFTISLGADSRTLTEQATGTYVIAEGAQSVTCSLSSSESASKVGK
ncbi:MAG: hypothetical protein JST54_17825 [Deltaproteobacteria bacterium]|nr:hypothetical protein [Deltaproteobacteria bacterium]